MGTVARDRFRANGPPSRFSLGLSVLLLGGCARVESTISVFHELGPTPTATYCLQRLPTQIDSLEHASYEAVVREELGKHGLAETACSAANLAVLFAYEIDNGYAVTHSYPIFGQTGVQSSQTSGTYAQFGNTGTYSATTSYTPRFGIVGTGTSTGIVYTRVLVVNIFDRNANPPRKVYEATVTSVGSNGQMPVVLPTMLRELLDDFPGQSGSVRQVSRRIRH